MKRRKTAAGLLAASLLVGAAPVVTNAAPVRIVSTSITEQSSSGYRVNVTFSADAGVSRVMMPTWTEANGQDDIVWHQASVSGNTASFYVPVSAHKGESGAYITHIYVYDRTIGGITASRSSAGGDECGASENCINKHNRTVFVRLSCKCNIFGRCRCEPCYDADMDRGKRTG